MTTDQVAKPEVDATLPKKLIRQVEFYFGDFNLHRDKFMQEHMLKKDGWFSMEIMLHFARLSSLCSDAAEIMAALQTSSSGLLELDVVNNQIRRNPSKPLPNNDGKYARALKLRTVFVKGFPQTESIEDLTDFLEEYGTVDGIKLCRFPASEHKGSIFKGSLFVTYSTFEEAEKFVQAPMVTYKEVLLEKKSKIDYLKENEKNADKNGKNNNTKTYKPEVPVGFLYVEGLDDAQINHRDMKEVWEEMSAPSFKFFYKFEKEGSNGFMVFPSEDDVKKSLDIMKEKNLEELTVKTSTNVVVREMPEDMLEKSQECYKSLREKFMTKKPGHGKFGRGGPKKRRSHTKFDQDDEPAAKVAKVEE